MLNSALGVLVWRIFLPTTWRVCCGGSYAATDTERWGKNCDTSRREGRGGEFAATGGHVLGWPLMGQKSRIRLDTLGYGITNLSAAIAC